MPHFSRLLFLKKFQRHMRSISVWYMIKQTKPLQTRYDVTYIYDRYDIRTHVYVFLFNVKKQVSISGSHSAHAILTRTISLTPMQIVRVKMEVTDMMSRIIIDDNFLRLIRL